MPTAITLHSHLKKTYHHHTTGIAVFHRNMVNCGAPQTQEKIQVIEQKTVVKDTGKDASQENLNIEMQAQSHQKDECQKNRPYHRIPTVK